MDKNQTPETPEQEEEYTGILGDFQESAEPEASISPAPDEPAKKNSPLKIAGIAVASAAILGCLVFLGVKVYNPDKNAETSSQSELTASESSSVSDAAASLPANPNAAVYSENSEISPNLMECFYHDYLNQVASALSYYGLDAETSNLKEEKLPEDAGEDMTWFEYIMAQAKASASQLLVFQEAANEAGYTMTDEDKQSVEEQLASADLTTYGKNATEDDVRTMIEMQVLASSYFNYILENMEFTDEELDAYYQANKNKFDTCGLMGFSIPYDVPDETAETDAETESGTPSLTEEQAKALADTLMKATSPEDFEQQVHDILLNYQGYTEDELTDLRESISNDSFSYTEGFEVSDWAFGGTAKVGETYLMEKEGCYSVYLLTKEAGLDTTNTVNVRHILFSTSNHMDSDSEDESLSEDETQPETTAEEAEAAEKAALETCWTYARNALAEWEKGDKTEDSFAELANQYSEDPGSNTTGGLYEKVYPGQMVQAFNDWCFDASRKPGDTGLVETNYGVHVMYFSGTAEPLWKDTARNALQSDSIDSWYDEQEQKYPVAYNDDIINAIE